MPHCEVNNLMPVIAMVKFCEFLCRIKIDLKSIFLYDMITQYIKLKEFFFKIKDASVEISISNKILLLCWVSKRHYQLLGKTCKNLRDTLVGT